MSAKSAPNSSPSSNDTPSIDWFSRTTTSCMPSPTKRSRVIETWSWRSPPLSGFRRKNAAEKYSTLPAESGRGVAPFSVSFSRERKRVSSAKRPLVWSPTSPRSSQMQKVDPSRIVNISPLFRAEDAHSGGLRERHDDDLVNVHVRGARDREEDAVRDVLRAHRPAERDVRVDRARLLLVAAEAHAGEVRLDEARRDRGHADRPPEQVFAQRARERVHG